MTHHSSNDRGMPRWREKQLALSIGEKIELIGKFIQETRQLEKFKISCKPSATSLNSLLTMDR